MKKIIFCGFGKLGKDCLEKLIIEGYTISHILTHKELDDESVDTYAIKNNLNYTYKDARKNLSEIKYIIVQQKPDYLISVNYRYIIPREIFEIPKYAINIHGSLLPKYRGRTPHVWSIINGEQFSGITAHIIEESVDTGDIIAQIRVKIEPEDTGYTLLKKFEEFYPDLVITAIDNLEKNKDLHMQIENNASFYGKRIPEMGYIDFYKNSFDVINFVRAQANPYPGAYYYLIDGRKIIINRLVVEEFASLDLPIGVISKVNTDYYVKCKDNFLKLIDYKIVN